MGDSSNVIIKCLGKALKTSIKYVVAANVKFFEQFNKEITSKVTKQNNNLNTSVTMFICLGKKFIFFIKDDMKKIYECISYKNLISYEYDKKSSETLILNTQNIKKLDYTIVKISVNSKNRNVFKNNIMCYYSIYYQYYHDKIISLKENETNNKNKKLEIKENEEEEIKNSKYHKEIIKGYSCYLRGIIKKLQSSQPSYHIKYIKEKKKNPKTFEEEENYFSNECDLFFDITEQIPINTFDNNENIKDISFHSYEYVLNILSNQIKSQNYWILENESFNKKINMNEDMSLWEGWKIIVRTCEPIYSNIIFLFLRRKYIPPYFDTYQDFCIILNEKCSLENYEINPEAFKIINLASNTLSSPITTSVKKNELFLKAKVDSLLVDEDTLYFYQNVYGIIGDDIYTFGYEFLSSLISYFEETNVKDKIIPLKSIVEYKKKKFGLECNKWKFNYFHDFMGKIFENIEKITKVKIPKNEELEKEIDKNTKNEKNNDENNNIEQLIDDISVTEEKSPSGKNKNIKNLSKQNFVNIWTKKLSRFLAFVLNGGLTDYKINYEDFLRNILDTCQNSNNDLSDLCYNTINFKDLQIKSNDIFQNKSILVSLDSTNTSISFNHDAMVHCISSNFLQKYLESIGYKFISTILVNRCTNKILKALYEDLKCSDNINYNNETRNIINLISPLRQIFEDNRQNPITLLLVAKCLCMLTKNDKYKVHRIKLIYEGNVLKTISEYLKKYNYNKNLVLACLDLIGYIIGETQNKLKEILYSDNHDGLMDRLLLFLEKPNVPGVYYSQLIMIKVLTLILNLTTIIEADCRNEFNNDYQFIYGLLINLLVNESREKIVDPDEEESSILDFKIYYLIMILTSKKESAQNYLFDSFNFIQIIEDNSEKYLKQMNSIIQMKDKISDAELKAIGKKVYKFMEMVYYLIINNDDRKKEIFNNCVNFKELKEYCENNIYSILKENDVKSDVLNMLTKVFTKVQEDIF